MTGKISCLIVDDEEPAHEVLKFLISKLSWLTYAGSCYNALEALEMIPEVKPDIIFLDVNMPELSGLDLLNIVQAPDSHVIMTTAYPEYAVDGFTFDVTAFLLKPVGFDRFLKAVTKVRRLIGDSHLIHERSRPDAQPTVATANDIAHSNHQQAPVTQLPEQRTETVQEEYMWIRADRKMYCVWFKDIYFVEGLKDYVKVYYTDGVLVTLASMAAMTTRLPSPTFVRTHRSYIVNRNMIKMIEGNMVTMLNGMKVSIAVSPTRDEVLRQLTER